MDPSLSELSLEEGIPRRAEGHWGLLGTWHGHTQNPGAAAVGQVC